MTTDARGEGRLAGRHGGLFAVRLATIALVAAVVIAAPAGLEVTDRTAALGACAFAAAVQTLAWAIPRHRPRWLPAAVWTAIVADAAWAGAVVVAVGGPTGPAAGLFVLTAIWAAVGYSAWFGLFAGALASAAAVSLLVAEGGDPSEPAVLGRLAFLWAVALSAIVGSAAGERELRTRAARLAVLHGASRRLLGADDQPELVGIARAAAREVMPGWSVTMRRGEGPTAAVLRRSGLDAILVVPIATESHTFGAIECRRPLLAGGVNPGVAGQDLEALETLAASLAAGLRHADLVGKLARQSLTDALTGLGNRRSFDIEMARRSAEARRSGRPLSLCLVDIDHFKSYNDSFGHRAGDEMLAAVAQALRASSRQADIPARYGGEEMALILPDTAHRDALEVAERVRIAVASLTAGRRPVTVSIGVATAEGACSAEVAVEAADRALYAAKEGGRNRVAGGAAQVPTPAAERG